MMLRFMLLITLFSSTARADALFLQSTTSTANSGLYEYLLPFFHDDFGIDVSVVAVGTGQAIKNAENCDADVLLVHAKEAELAFVERGGGLERFDLMYNDFVLVGPGSDPSDVRSAVSIVDALRRIAIDQSRFASRSDDSGTHRKELMLWQDTGIDPKVYSGTWYLETGAGMGTTLNIGIGMIAYVLTDRATWQTFQNKLDYEILFEGDAALFNQYGVIAINPHRCPNVNAEHAQLFVDWLLSDSGQKRIADFRVNGQQLFFPNAIID